MRNAVMFLIAAVLLCSCAEGFTFRYSPEAVHSLQTRYPLPRFDGTGFDAPSAAAEFGCAAEIFTYGSSRRFISPAGGNYAAGEKARLAKQVAAAAINAAFDEEGVFLEAAQLLEFDNVSVTLDGFSKSGGIGFIFVTAWEMRKGPYGSYVGGRAFIDPDEVFALQSSKYGILVVSDNDPRFLFDAGLDTNKPAMDREEIIRNRDAAAAKLYAAARLWVRARHGN